MKLARTGALLFLLWGLLHIVGGASIVISALDDPDKAYEIYRGDPEARYPGAAGAVFAYFGYGLVVVGAAASLIAIRYNWRNNKAGLAANTLLVGLTDVGLVAFLVLPGYLSWEDASPGLLLFLGATVLGGMACSTAHSKASRS